LDRGDFAIGRDFPQMAQMIFGYSAVPKQLETFSGDYHLIDLFQSERGDALMTLILAFFAD
jgi:hypothetical protein